MNNKIKYTVLMIVFIFIFSLSGQSEYQQNIINKLRISVGDIPEGFIYGKVPSSYKNLFKDNPWMLDTVTIQKLAKNIYPDGDFRTIAGIHMSILADQRTPFGDDIVCFLILYKNNKTAEKELKKINDYTQFNRDRAIVISKNNLAVFLHVDDISNFHYIQKMADNYEQKIEELESGSECAAIK